MDSPNKVNKSLEIAKDINSEVQSLVNKLFEKSEATEALKASDPDIYFMKSNQILAAIVACASQKVLSDGLMRRKLGYKLNAGATLAWELFLNNNPDIAVKVAEAKAASAAKYAAQAASESSEDADEDDSESADE